MCVFNVEKYRPAADRQSLIYRRTDDVVRSARLAAGSRSDETRQNLSRASKSCKKGAQGHQNRSMGGLGGGRSPPPNIVAAVRGCGEARPAAAPRANVLSVPVSDRPPPTNSKPTNFSCQHTHMEFRQLTLKKKQQKQLFVIIANKLSGQRISLNRSQCLAARRSTTPRPR